VVLLQFQFHHKPVCEDASGFISTGNFIIYLSPYSSAGTFFLRKRGARIMQPNIWCPFLDPTYMHNGQRLTRLLTAATTPVSIRHTRVIRTALTARAGPRTLWLRLRSDPSPKRRVAIHTSLVLAIIPCLILLWHVELSITLAARAWCFL